MDPILSPASGSQGREEGWGAERSVLRSISRRETSSLTKRTGAAARVAAADVGCEMALELSLKALEAQAHKQPALGRKAPRMNRAPTPLCNCAFSPRQTHGNPDSGTIFPSGLAALLRYLLSYGG